MIIIDTIYFKKFYKYWSSNKACVLAYIIYQYFSKFGDWA